MQSSGKSKDTTGCSSKNETGDTTDKLINLTIYGNKVGCQGQKFHHNINTS